MELNYTQVDPIVFFGFAIRDETMLNDLLSIVGLPAILAAQIRVSLDW